MDKTYSIYKDPAGIFPTEHRITYTTRNPSHKKYNFADVSFCFDPEKQKLKRLDFFIDEKLMFVNLALGVGYSSPVWFFQKKGSYQKISDEEISLMLTAASDVLQEYPKMPKGFKKTFEVLPRQAEIYGQIFDGNTTKQEKRTLLKSLREKNVILKHVQYRYKYLVEKRQPLQIGG